MVDISRYANPTQQNRSQRSLERILLAAETILRTEGLDAFSMNGVARESGLSIGGIYRRFPNREALLLAVKEMHIDRGIAKLTHDLDFETTSLDDAVSAFTGSLIHNYSSEEMLYSAILVATASDGQLADSGTRMRKAFLKIYTRAVKRHADEIPRKDVDVALKASFEVIMSTIVRRVQRVGQGRPLINPWGTIRRELPLMIAAYLKTA